MPCYVNEMTSKSREIGISFNATFFKGNSQKEPVILMTSIKKYILILWPLALGVVANMLVPHPYLLCSLDQCMSLAAF